MNESDERPWRRWLGRSRALFRRIRAMAAQPQVRRLTGRAAAASFLVTVLASGLHRVHEGQVGVVVNNLTGSMRVVEQVGFRYVLPGLQRFHRLDRRVQTLRMSEEGSEGFAGGDAVLVKTSDGSNVTVAVEVSYRLRPQLAAVVLRNAGPGRSFGDLWVRSAVRAAVSTELGKMTTEQVYDAAARDERAAAVVGGLNEQLEPHGIEVVAVIVTDFRFYKEYEEIIKNKKLADQEVEEQQAQARLATEQQRKQVAAAKFAAAKALQEAEGRAERVRAEADGYVARVALEADAELVTARATAEGARAVGLAEAEGLREGARALAGGGGVNLVALEYAKRLKDIQFTGVPVLEEGRRSQYRISRGEAAAAADGLAEGGTR